MISPAIAKQIEQWPLDRPSFGASDATSWGWQHGSMREREDLILKRGLMKRLERLQAARHDTSAPQFQLIELERGRFGIAPARVAQGPIPVIILPTMPETPVPQEFPKISENVYEPGTALQDGRSKGLTKLPMPTTDRAAAFHSEAMDGVGISTKVPLHGYPGQPPRHGPYAGSVGMSGLEDRH